METVLFVIGFPFDVLSIVTVVARLAVFIKIDRTVFKLWEGFSDDLCHFDECRLVSIHEYDIRV